MHHVCMNYNDALIKHIQKTDHKFISFNTDVESDSFFHQLQYFFYFNYVYPIKDNRALCTPYT